MTDARRRPVRSTPTERRTRARDPPPGAPPTTAARSPSAPTGCSTSRSATVGDIGERGRDRSRGATANLWTPCSARSCASIRRPRATVPYTVPADNPFAGGGGLPEIWHHGLRNPWRFSFDRAPATSGSATSVRTTGRRSTSCPATPGGLNFGYPLLEGTHPLQAHRGPGHRRSRLRAVAPRRELRGDRRDRVPRQGRPRAARPLRVRRLLQGGPQGPEGPRRRGGVAGQARAWARR